MPSSSSRPVVVYAWVEELASDGAEVVSSIGADHPLIHERSDMVDSHAVVQRVQAHADRTGNTLRLIALRERTTVRVVQPRRRHPAAFPTLAVRKPSDPDHQE